MAADPPLDRRARGARVEAAARAELERAGLRLQAANVGYRGGELDLVMHEPGSEGGTLVFVEVRSRTHDGFGGAGASISATKQQRIIFAARHYLMRLPSPPPCRFDVVLVEDRVQWLKAAFDAQ